MYIEPVFTYLSEDKLLDNDASKFIFGLIKDAWVFGKQAYVVTEDNALYEYDYNASLWKICGNFDIKRLEFVSATLVFLLTNDGKLYHKGSAVANVADEHTEFTQIFPDCYIYDFTCGSATLTVLKD